MKSLYLIVLAFIIFSCKKETYSGRILGQEIALTQNQSISNPTPNHIVKDTTIAGKRITTYDNGAVMELTPTKITGQWNAVVKFAAKSMPFVYKETVSGLSTLCTYQSSTGLIYFTLSITKKTGQITESRFFNDLPVIQLGLNTLTTGGCVKNAINICIHSRGCYLLCSTGGWGGCIFGWYLMCF